MVQEESFRKVYGLTPGKWVALICLLEILKNQIWIPVRVWTKVLGRPCTRDWLYFLASCVVLRKLLTYLILLISWGYYNSNMKFLTQAWAVVACLQTFVPFHLSYACLFSKDRLRWAILTLYKQVTSLARCFSSPTRTFRELILS
jgi:hypothetical protein